MRTITREEIKEKLCKHEGYSPEKRELVEVRPICDHGRVGCIILIVDGSPPKGYAIVEPRNRWISLYDAHGKRFRILDGFKLTEEGGEANGEWNK